MLATENHVQSRHVLLERLETARSVSDQLFEIVKPAFLCERPIPERHRIVFYIGHLESFDWNLLRERIVDVPSFHPEFDRLFAFGIDPVGGGLPTDTPRDWPALEEVRGYTRCIRESLDSALEKAMVSPSSREFSADMLLNVAIEHRLMHAETLAYMFHQLPLEQKVFKSSVSQPVADKVEPGMIEIPSGSARLGISRDDEEQFGWDNEYEAHDVDVPLFAIDKYKVTNRRYMEFMSAGGYEQPAYWREDDWNWRNQHDISQPVFWTRVKDGWRYRTMFNEIELPLDWPVYVSHAEASAYARWARKQLPTEPQWHRAAYGALDDSERLYPWGNDAPRPHLGNFDFERWDPAPVNVFPDGQSAFGVQDLLGNGWEWTSTVFGPFPGFQQFSFYPGYSANFFDGKHYVMKGGSARTAACMLRRSFRNWFQAHYQYVYAGFRCASK
jgi:gamma-glutamyl hercynylcysteine S-oxide synthase